MVSYLHPAIKYNPFYTSFKQNNLSQMLVFISNYSFPHFQNVMRGLFLLAEQRNCVLASNEFAPISSLSYYNKICEVENSNYREFL